MIAVGKGPGPSGERTLPAEEVPRGSGSTVAAATLTFASRLLGRGANVPYEGHH